MINYTTGDLLSSGAQALVNTVNCVGVMGKGIALHFKQAFPHNFAVYADACRRREVQPGRMLVVEDSSKEFGKHLIVNFPTKQHWRNPSQYEWVEAGLQDLVRVIREQHISSIAVPPLGCGNGGLDWGRVKPMIEQALNRLEDVTVTVYEPSAAAAVSLAGQVQNADARLTPARAMLLYAMFCYEAHDERCSLFVANKLSYFYQLLGEESFARMPFVAHYYGPYSVSVGHMLSAINGKYLHGLEEMDKRPFEALMLDYDRKSEVGEYVHKQLSEGQRDHIRSLLRLIDGYESAYALEVLASVAYMRELHKGIGLDECVSEVQGWSSRKRNLFQREHIEAAYRHLELQGK